MNLSCPYCGVELALAHLQQPAGIGGGTYCPKCFGRVYLGNGYEKALVFASVFASFGVLWLFGVRELVFLILGTILLAIFLGMYLQTVSVRYTLPTLKRWRSHKTFFEWLHDRNSSPSSSDKT
jgi:hypothetical protein